MNGPDLFNNNNMSKDGTYCTGMHTYIIVALWIKSQGYKETESLRVCTSESAVSHVVSFVNALQKVMRSDAVSYDIAERFEPT